MYQAKSGVKNFSLYLGGGRGCPLTKNFFPSLNMYQAKSGVKNFSLYLGGGRGVPWQKIFSPVWTCIRPNLVSKIFPFTWGGGVPRQKIFFPVWTCIKPNLVSKFFPFTETRYPLDLGPSLQTWTWDPPSDLDLGHPPRPRLGTPPTWTWTWDPPYLDLD